MILARGCASRLLVLSASGNLRALVTGLILTVVAQASLRGALSPFREWLSALWIVDGPARDMLAGLPAGTGVMLGIAGLSGAIMLARHLRLPSGEWLGGIGVGVSIALGWMLTYALSSQSFEPVAVQSVTFTGPSADTLMALVNEPDLPLTFGIGLVVGVFAGSLVSALLRAEFVVQGFDQSLRMPRYITGATLMGFGGMLAGGCAVGAGVTGGSVFALTAWLALLAMWLGAGLTDLLVDRGVSTSPATAVHWSQALGRR